MKYALMFTHTPELADRVPEERRQEVYGQIFAWFQEHGSAGRIANMGAELQPVSTATTVKAPTDGGDKPLVVDGPFSEAKEVVGGFSVVDVPDLDAAIELARSWPALQFPGDSVEIRPIVDHEGM
jgi:hypothetical protein